MQENKEENLFSHHSYIHSFIRPESVLLSTRMPGVFVSPDDSILKV